MIRHARRRPDFSQHHNKRLPKRLHRRHEPVVPTTPTAPTPGMGSLVWPPVDLSAKQIAAKKRNFKGPYRER